MLTGMDIGGLSIHQTDDSIDEIADIAERTCLTSVAVNRQLLTTERLHDKIRNHASVVLEHSLAVGIKDADDARVYSVLAVVIHHQSLGDALAFVVATP